MKVAIIGAGQLGSRHLQAFSLSVSPVEIQVLDLSADSLAVAKQRMNQTKYDKNLIHVEYVDTYSNLATSFDFVVIATGADVRFKALESLLERSEVKYVLLEKVLFQETSEYLDALNLLEKHKVSAWVNCPQRTWGIYQQIKSKLKPGCEIEMSVTGGEWGLACNSIHYIDLFSYLSFGDVTGISTKHLMSKIIPSKRESFVEIVGCLNAWDSLGSHLSLRSFENSSAPAKVMIETSDVRFEIFENERTYQFSSVNSGWEWQKSDYKVPFQSQVTQLVAEQLLTRGACGLSTYKESMDLHLPLITELNSFISEITNERVLRCPIT